MITDVLGLFGIDFSGIFNFGSWFLIFVGLFWLVFASVQDFKHREVENWWSFGLIVFAIVFRIFLSINSGNYWFILWGLIGLVAGFVIAEIFYYARLFAGGDAKLLMALGVVLPLAVDWKTNLFILILFFLCLVFLGAVYGLIYSLILIFVNFKNFRKEFSRQFKAYKRMVYFTEIAMALLFFVLIFLVKFYIGAFLAGLLFFCPLLLIYAKAIEESCMNKFVNVGELTIGDWLVKPVKIKIRGKGKTKLIKPYWEGLSEEELKIIQDNFKGKVLVKYGIPFVPAILLAFTALIIILVLII
jgi:Flp pilus assembly protein protease CpaA